MIIKKDLLTFFKYIILFLLKYQYKPLRALRKIFLIIEAFRSALSHFKSFWLNGFLLLLKITSTTIIYTDLKK